MSCSALRARQHFDDEPILEVQCEEQCAGDSTLRTESLMWCNGLALNIYTVSYEHSRSALGKTWQKSHPSWQINTIDDITRSSTKELIVDYQWKVVHHEVWDHKQSIYCIVHKLQIEKLMCCFLNLRKILNFCLRVSQFFSFFKADWLRTGLRGF